MAEMISKYPLFPGDSEIGQLQLISEVLSILTKISFTSKNELNSMIENSNKFFGINVEAKNIRNFHRELGNKISKSAIILLSKFLEINPKKRISAQEALKQPFLKKSNLTNFSSLFSRGRLPKADPKPSGLNKSSRKELKTSLSGPKKKDQSFNSLASDNNISSNKSIITSKKVIQASNKLPRIFIPSLDIKRRTLQEKFGKPTLKELISTKDRDFNIGNLSDRSHANNTHNSRHTSQLQSVNNSKNSKKKITIIIKYSFFSPILL